ncbi:MAG TPA: glycosyltransferase family 39 protein [Casimicrobiaceae bacterium]|nr:glycosyltransferase family 39 protein [Casimicrobiaceae bacterium]
MKPAPSESAATSEPHDGRAPSRAATGGATLPLFREDSDAPLPWVALAALTGLAVLLRTIGIGGELWLDEIHTLIESIRHPLAQIVTVFPDNNQHTLYSVLAHASIEAFGEQPWSLRLPALLFGAASPAALYLLAREFTSRFEALLSGALLAVSYHGVWFSQNARGYSALAFFALLSSWLLLRALRRGRTTDFLWYAVACALGTYTHMTMVFLVMGHAAACAVRLPPSRGTLSAWRRPLIGFALAAALTLALYAPLLLDVQQFFLKRTMPPAVATPGWALKAVLAGLQLGMSTALAAVVGTILLLTGLWSYFRQSRFLAALFVLPAAFTIAAVLALRQPIFPRFLFFLAGFAVMIVVRGALEIGARISRRRPDGSSPAPATLVGTALVGAMVAASAASLPFDYRYPKQDFEGAMRFVEARRAPAEPVATASGATYPYLRYYGRPWEGVKTLAQLQQVRARGQRVWVLYTFADYIQADAPELMRALRDECAIAGVFRGTVAGGDVTVCTLPPSNRSADASAR